MPDPPVDHSARGERHHQRPRGAGDIRVREGSRTKVNIIDSRRSRLDIEYKTIQHAVHRYSGPGPADSWPHQVEVGCILTVGKVGCRLSTTSRERGGIRRSGRSRGAL